MKPFAKLDETGCILAANLDDVEKVLPAMFDALLRGKLDLGAPVRVDPNNSKAVGVAFRCDLLTAAAVCDELRRQDRVAGVSPFRVYVKRAGWVQMPGSVYLTVLVDGAPALNPDVFAGQGLKVEAKQPERVEL